jgi:hypothetical protein
LKPLGGDHHLDKLEPTLIVTKCFNGNVEEYVFEEMRMFDSSLQYHKDKKNMEFKDIDGSHYFILGNLKAYNISGAKK